MTKSSVTLMLFTYTSFALLSACTEAVPSQSDIGASPLACVDNDQDGYGTNCILGMMAREGRWALESATQVLDIA